MGMACVLGVCFCLLLFVSFCVICLSCVYVMIDVGCLCGSMFLSGMCMLLAMHVLLFLLELTMMVIGFCFYACFIFKQLRAFRQARS